MGSEFETAFEAKLQSLANTGLANPGLEASRRTGAGDDDSDDATV